MKPAPRRVTATVLRFLLPVLCFLLSACVDTHPIGSLGEHFHQSAPPSESPYPLKVAIVADEAIKSERAVFRDHPCCLFTIMTHPGLINAVQAELATLFKEVRIIDNASQARDEDLLATVESSVESMGSSGGGLFGGPDRLNSRLKVRFKDLKTGMPVTSYTGDRVIIINFSAGRLSTRLEAHVRTIGDQQTQHMREMSAKLRSDRKLAAYLADRGQFVAQVSGQSSGPATLSEEDRLSVTDPRGVKVIGKPPAQFVADQFGKSWAVVIGIDDYEKAPRLKYGVADAKAMTTALTQQGFQVTTLYNQQATKAAIERELGDKLVDRVGEQDHVVIFYAGHGETKTAKGGKTMGYLLPVQGQQEALSETAISMGRIKELADALPSKQVLFLVDTCYGGIAGQQFRSTLPAMTVAYLRQITRERGRQLITAGGPDQRAMESPEWGHSVFTYYVLEGLKGLADLNADGIIPASELYSYLDSRVFSAAQMKGHTQRPELWSLAAEKGEFVFIPAKKPAAK